MFGAAGSHGILGCIMPAALGFCILTEVALAAPVTITGYEAASTSNSSGHQEYNPNNPTAQSYSSTVPRNFSVSVSTPDGFGGATVTTAATIGSGNLGLHGTISTFGGAGEFDMYTSDSLTITGTPGVQQFSYLLQLDAGATAFSPNIARAYGGFAAYISATWTEPGTVAINATCNPSSGTDASGTCGRIGIIDVNESWGSHSTGTYSGILNLQSGTTIVISEYLWGRAYSDANGVSSFDAASTGFLTLTPITPGAGFISEGSLNYLNNPDVAIADVPEPATLALLSAGLLGIVAARRRKAM